MLGSKSTTTSSTCCSNVNDPSKTNEVNFEHSLFMVRVDIIKTTMDLEVVTTGIRDLSFGLEN